MKLRISPKIWFYICLFAAIIGLFVIFQLMPSREGARNRGKKGGKRHTKPSATTAKPTTAKPTTAKPTTAQPTTAKPTTKPSVTTRASIKPTFKPTTKKDKK